MSVQKKRNHDEAGFTILEIVVVLVLMAALYAVVMPNVGKRMDMGKQKTAEIQLGFFKSMLEEYRLDNGMYPTTEQGLEALVTKPTIPPIPENWNGPYTNDEAGIPKDPWNRPYVYRCPGNHRPNSYDLFSMGSDGKEGGTGSAADITNWKNTSKERVLPF